MIVISSTFYILIEMEAHVFFIDVLLGPPAPHSRNCLHPTLFFSLSSFCVRVICEYLGGRGIQVRRYQRKRGHFQIFSSRVQLS
jgi:hypothetical protein